MIKFWPVSCKRKLLSRTYGRFLKRWPGCAIVYLDCALLPGRETWWSVHLQLSWMLRPSRGKCRALKAGAAERWSRPSLQASLVF